MSSAHCLYSCVVDRGAKFDRQCHLWLLSLLSLANIHPSRMVVHLVGAHPALENVLRAYAVPYVHVAPFGDKTYCNKLAQCTSPLLASSDYVFCTDCDLLIVRPLDSFARPDSLAGTVVDLPNPPLSILTEIFTHYTIPLPPSIPCRNTKMTLCGNCNGGLYGIPHKYLATLGRVWRLYALDMLASEHIQALLGPYAKHIDQISFALAVAKMQAPLTNLPMECNLPLHLVMHLEDSHKERYAREQRPIFAVHYHDCITPEGLLTLSGIETVDRELQKINTLISNTLL